MFQIRSPHEGLKSFALKELFNNWAEGGFRTNWKIFLAISIKE
jgi:hypothetical protein